MFFTQCLVIPSGDFHCDGSGQIGCILGLMCCVKMKGLFYLLFFRGGCLLSWSRWLCLTFKHALYAALIAAMVPFLSGMKIRAAKLFGSWHLDCFLGHQ